MFSPDTKIKTFLRNRGQIFWLMKDKKWSLRDVFFYRINIRALFWKNVLWNRHSYYSIEILQTIASTLKARLRNVINFILFSILIIRVLSKVNQNSLLELKMVFFWIQICYFLGARAFICDLQLHLLIKLYGSTTYILVRRAKCLQMYHTGLLDYKWHPKIFSCTQIT